MQALYDLNAPKKPANLSVNSDLLRRARERNINLSAALEQALADVLKKQQRDEWLAANQDTIAAYNLQVQEQGVFSDGIRTF